jgi:acyl dehydratase
MTTRELPKNGPGVLARAAFSFRRKARPLPKSFENSYQSLPIDQGHLARYQSFIGFTQTQHVPLSYFYFFAQRAQLSTMLDRRFTYPVPGLVHVANAMQLVEPIDLLQPLYISIEAKQQPPDATGRLYILFDVLISQRGKLKIKCDSRYLGKRGQSPSVSNHANSPLNEVNPATVAEEKAEKALMPNASWTLPDDLGRRYAALSGDHNPIHLWPWSARLFGFKRPIAHGMYSIAKVQALLEDHFAARVDHLSANFIKPALLPGHVQLAVDRNNFCLSCDTQVIATGSFETVNSL